MLQHIVRDILSWQNAFGCKSRIVFDLIDFIVWSEIVWLHGPEIESGQPRCERRELTRGCLPASTVNARLALATTFCEIMPLETQIPRKPDYRPWSVDHERTRVHVLSSELPWRNRWSSDKDISSRERTYSQKNH